MSTGERIQQLGFKRWYERTLIEGHIYLVTALFGLILAFAGLEVIAEHEDIARFILGFAAGSMGVMLAGIGLLRYQRILMLALSFGDRATCRQCNTYAAFNVLATGESNGGEPAVPTSWLNVRCRHCGHEWRM